MKTIRNAFAAFFFLNPCFACERGDTLVTEPRAETFPIQEESAADITTPTLGVDGQYRIEWKGITWLVKHATNRDEPRGPGENIWSSQNVWVDDQGKLHLKITRQPDGRYLCAELQSENDYQYGTYTWKVDSDLSGLQKDVIFGLFQYGGTDYINEIDFEFTRWNNASANWCNYTVYRNQVTTSNPEVNYVHVDYSEPLDGTYTTHTYTREANKITFKSYHGHGTASLFTNIPGGTSGWVFAEPDNVPTKAMPVYIQLWTKYKNVGNYELNSPSVEVVVNDFTFTP
ncbi:glycoside hydrolase family 16 protein [Parapedobacter pyrenivorans]|uniref:glycoside hydrolase family 16 protein n=1 Tax=Parapedobacter pyrenivorans TaxID=1305674 RepID=UPI00333F5AF7